MAVAGAPWQLECEKMEQRYGYLLASGQWSDCTFMVGSETNQTAVPAHKLVLATASPVFEAMFFGALSECNDPIVQIPDVQPQAFRALLQYIYTGNTDIGSFDMAWDLWYGAKKYMLPHLIKECNRYISSVLGPKNACRTYEFACLFDEKTLMKNCIKIISTSTKEVLNASSFEEVQLNTLMTVCSLDQLNVDSELDLFHAVARYAKAEPKRQRQVSPHVNGEPPSEVLSEKGLLPSGETSSQTSPAAELDSKPAAEVVLAEPTAGIENLKEVSEEPTIRGALQKVRFLSLSAAQFADGPARSGLLTEAETLAIFMNIAFTVSAVPMPTGFSECRERRQQRIDSVVEGPIAKPRLKPCSESRGGSETKTTLTTPAEIVRGLLSHERETLEHAARAARHMTCADVDGTSETLTQLVAAGGIPPLMAALHHPRPAVQYDAAWALTNIACDGEHAKAIVNAGAVPVLVGLLGRGGAGAEQAAWALGNIAGAADTASATIMDAGAGPALLAHMLPSTPSVPLATFLRTYRLLCQHLEKFELVTPAVPYIENLLVVADEQVLAETCWVLYHLVEGVKLNPKLFTPTLAARLTALMGHAAPRVQAAALGAVGSMLGTTELIERCFEAGCLDHLMNFLKCGNPSLVDTAASVCCFFLRTQSRIQQALDEGILEAVGLILTQGHNICVKHAADAITNICLHGSSSQLRAVAEFAALQPYCRQLASTSACLGVLYGLTALLKNIEENTKPALLLKLREFGVPQLLITVHLDSNEEIRELANGLLITHFLN